jgi:hypothetical protein
MSRVPERAGILPSLAKAGGGGGLICTAMERLILPDLVGVAQLRFFLTMVYLVNVHKILPPAGVITLVDSCYLSVSSIAG